MKQAGPLAVDAGWGHAEALAGLAHRQPGDSLKVAFVDALPTSTEALVLGPGAGEAGLYPLDDALPFELRDAPRTAIWSRPAGVVVSIPSLSETKATPSAWP